MRVRAFEAGARERFAFGKNWRAFSSSLTRDQIDAARAGVATLLGTSDLRGLTFLDVGSGSGLMSLVAHQMGAQVTAFDFDPASVATTIAVRDREAGPGAFDVVHGSILDSRFMASLGRFEIVYAWGVLHHTGDLWAACERAAAAVSPNGILAVAIYNDQGLKSQLWREIKKSYVSAGPLRRRLLVALVGLYFRARGGVGTLLRAAWTSPPGGFATTTTAPVANGKEPRRRGMNRHHDLVDWVGGYPFEVAKPEEVFEFFRHRGYTLEGLTTCAGGFGCNEYLFRRTSPGL